MPGKDERAVRKQEHQAPAARTPLDWEDARVFLAISRHKSFRAASGALHQSVNALRRRLSHLERQLGVTLFTRHIDGVRLTAEGERVAAIAERMEENAFDLVRATGQADVAPKGDVRLAITEGLGALWVAPRMGDFHHSNPQVVVDLQSGMTRADVLRLEADVAVQLVRPEAKDLRTVKLGRIHTMPFASKAYVDAHGVPKTPAEIAKHRIVLQLADQVTPPGEFERRFANVHLDHVVLRTNASLAHYWAVIEGVGIGMLPTYTYLAGAPLVPIDIGFRTQHDIWLVYHVDSGRIARVRRLIDWLIESFSPQRFPWFADEFVPPARLPQAPDSWVRNVSAVRPPR